MLVNYFKISGKHRGPQKIPSGAAGRVFEAPGFSGCSENSVVFSSSTFFSKLTKFELIITIF